MSRYRSGLGKAVTRRQVLKNSFHQLGGLALLSQLPLSAVFQVPTARSQDSFRHKFLHIFLRGGWDSHLATDPVIGSKILSGNFEPAYQNYAVTSVTGKANLRLGWGLQPAQQTFANVACCFLNGLFTEVTAHELAQNYMFSGVLSLSRSREFASLTALLGAAQQNFPAHVVLGSPVPLGSSKDLTPPLQAQSGGNLADMLRGPYNQWHKPETFAHAHNYIAQMDALYRQSLSSGAQNSLAAWTVAAQQLEGLYAAKLGESLAITDALKARYGFTESWSEQSLLPSALLTLASGLSPFVSISLQGYDTHSNHLSQHLPLLRQFSNSLNIFIDDMANTADPDDVSRSLLDTTTILISSEFVRTPLFNAGSGTDHWPSASAILMGRGVRDNQLIGSTDDSAAALGWSAGQVLPRSADTWITPAELMATILDFMEQPELANSISQRRIDELFV